MATNENPEHPTELTADRAAGSLSLRAWLVQNAVTLGIMAAVIGLMVKTGVDFLLVGKVAIGLGLVIFIHELGHFLAAKWCDVHVETFSIGFGPPLPGCHFTCGETTYMLALVPLGGYVKMVGEGSDSDEGEDDPRSFKNKTVGQRMLIISAGVIMNVILAAVCFVGIYTTTGIDRPSGVIGIVESGSPSWQKGLRTGALLRKIGDTENPYFDDVMPEVMHWPSGQHLPIEFDDFVPKRTTITVQVLPRKNDTTGRPMIGIAHTQKTVLAPKTRRGFPPVVPGSAAASAQPAFEHGDRIIGTTNPDHPTQTKALPPDPRDPGRDQTDFFELQRREQLLAGHVMTFLVRRAGAAADAAPLAIKVPAAYQTRFGVRMAMGPIVAIRDNSPAAMAGVTVKTEQDPGDKLTAVEFPGANNTIIRFASDRAIKVDPNVTEFLLDPVRLPDDLAEKIGSRPTTVTLTVQRRVGHKDSEEVKLRLDWDDHWRFTRSAPINPNSPIALDALGLAYTVYAVIDDVATDSPAARSELRKGDIIKAIQYYETSPEGKVEPSKWYDLALDQWPNAHFQTQRVDSRQIGLRVQRDQRTFDVAVTGDVDPSWPMSDRGILFATDTRLQKADHFGDALAMGGRRTQRLIGQIYQNLLAMIDGRISFKKNASGPLTIAAVSYDIAGESLERFILFLGMISVNLAVINFLPIPVLDGGHMVFLIYEKLRGRPAPEQLRFAATFLGLALIGSLMLFVIYLDVKRLLF